MAYNISLAACIVLLLIARVSIIVFPCQVNYVRAVGDALTANAPTWDVP